MKDQRQQRSDSDAAAVEGYHERWSTYQDPVVIYECSPSLGGPIRIYQDVATDEVGGSIWDASRYLAKYIETNESFVATKIRDKLKAHAKVLEVGSGCGFLGLLLARMGAHVTLTDKIELVPLLEKNVAMNTTDEDMKINNGMAVAKELCWGSPRDENIIKANKNFDFIFGTDVVYYIEILDPLIHTLREYASPTTSIIIAQEDHSPKTQKVFLTKMKEWFECEMIPIHEASQLDETAYGCYLFRLKTPNTKKK